MGRRGTHVTSPRGGQPDDARPGGLLPASRRHGQSVTAAGHSGKVVAVPAMKEPAMWWLLVLIVVALILGMVVALNRRGQGDPSFRPDDPRGGESLGGPGGQWGPGDGGGV